VDVAGVAYELNVPMSTFYQLPATGEALSLSRISCAPGCAQRCTASQRSRARGVPPADPHLRHRVRAPRSRCCPACRSPTWRGGGDAGSGPPCQSARIGKKTAERLLLELKGRLVEVTAGPRAESASDVVHALVWARLQRRKALAARQGPAGGIAVGRRQSAAALKTLANVWSCRKLMP